MTTMSAQEYNVFSVKTGEHKDYIKAHVYQNTRKAPPQYNSVSSVMDSVK